MSFSLRFLILLLSFLIFLSFIISFDFIFCFLKFVHTFKWRLEEFLNFLHFPFQYQTVLQTNGDGTFSLIQVDPATLQNNPSIITLPDGTTAQVQGVATVRIKIELIVNFKLTLNLLLASYSKRWNDRTHGSDGWTEWEHASRSFWSFGSRRSTNNNKRRRKWWESYKNF